MQLFAWTYTYSLGHIPGSETAVSYGTSVFYLLSETVFQNHCSSHQQCMSALISYILNNTCYYLSFWSSFSFGFLLEHSQQGSLQELAFPLEGCLMRWVFSVCPSRSFCALGDWPLWTGLLASQLSNFHLASEIRRKEESELGLPPPVSALLKASAPLKQHSSQSRPLPFCLLLLLLLLQVWQRCWLSTAGLHLPSTHPVNSPFIKLPCYPVWTLSVSCWDPDGCRQGPVINTSHHSPSRLLFLHWLETAGSRTVCEQQLFLSLQAYIKLGDYRKALVDCDWALKVRKVFPLSHDGGGIAQGQVSQSWSE